MQGVLQRVRDVHTSGELMHWRCWAFLGSQQGAPLLKRCLVVYCVFYDRLLVLNVVHWNDRRETRPSASHILHAAGLGAGATRADDSIHAIPRDISIHCGGSVDGRC